MISVGDALAVCSAVTFLFVGSIYLNGKVRVHRDVPEIMLFRMFVISVVTCVVPLVLPFVLGWVIPLFCFFDVDFYPMRKYSWKVSIES